MNVDQEFQRVADTLKAALMRLAELQAADHAKCSHILSAVGAHMTHFTTGLTADVLKVTLQAIAFPAFVSKEGTEP